MNEIYENIRQFILSIREPLPKPMVNEQWPNDVMMAVDYIYEHWHDSNLTLGTLRKEIYGGNGNDFSTDFAWCVGTHPKTLINDLRIAAGKKLLAEKRFRKLPVLMIARAVGFSGKGAFSHAFKEREGISPGKWRNENC